MERIATIKAPAAIGPYSQAVKSGSLLFCSGMLGIDPATAKLAGESIEEQTAQVLKNIAALLDSQRLSLSNIVKTTVFLADIADFPVVNELYAKAFGDHKPARSTVQVAKLPLAAKIEIESIAEFPQA